MDRIEIFNLMEKNCDVENDHGHIVGISPEKATDVATMMLQAQANRASISDRDALVLGIVTQLLAGSMSDRTVDAAVAKAKEIIMKAVRNG